MIEVELWIWYLTCFLAGLGISLIIDVIMQVIKRS